MTEPASGVDYCAKLAEDGYCVIRNILPVDAVHALSSDLAEPFRDTPFCEGGFYGSRTKRFGSLLKRSRHAATLVQQATIMSIVEQILAPWCDNVQLNLTQAIEIHPGALSQYPHRDQDMWQGVKGEVEYMVNVMWPFSPYNSENGATIVWPKSHGAKALETTTEEAPIVVECGPGDALLFLGSTLHGAGSNKSGHIRQGMIVSYCLGWLKPYENQWLAYPPSVAKDFSPELAGLVGYRQHRPNLGNYEGRCPSILLGSHVPQVIGAIDELRPDQASALAEYVAEQMQADAADWKTEKGHHAPLPQTKAA